MSGYSDGTNCPNCGKDADRYSDYKPFDFTSIECKYCGFQVGPQVTYMTLDELNIERKEAGMRPLKRLPKQDLNIM